jgi:hypothetical protein
MRRLTPLLAVLLLGLTLAACGESPVTPEPPQQLTPPPTPPPPPPPPPPAAQATGFTYTDPSGTGWRLVQDASSTSTRVVLNLVGPAGLKSRGAGFNLVAPAAVHFAKFTETNFPVKDGGTYELKNVAPTGPLDPLEPVLLAGGVKRGNLLTVGAFQKDRRATAKDSGATLLQIALEFRAEDALRKGQELPLTITKARYQAEDIGEFFPYPTYEMIAKAPLEDMTVAVGTLRAH